MKKKLLFTSIVLLAMIMQVNAQVYSEDFESGGADDWTFVDNDGDGNNWVEADASSIDSNLGTTSLVSYSYINNVGPVSPDNLAISPEIDLTSFTGNNLYLKYDYFSNLSYPAEKYSVYITTSDDPDDIIDATPAYTETVSSLEGVAENFVDLTDYIGENVYITFRHYDTTDQLYLIIDNLSTVELAEEDVILSSIDVNSTIPAGNEPIDGKFVNSGADNITSIEANWQVDDGTLHTETIDGLDVALNETYVFTHPDEWTATPGQHNLTVSITKVNGTSVTNSTNTTELSKAIQVATGSATRLPIFERFTSSTCAPCTAFNQNSFNGFFEDRKDDFAYIAYHMNFPGNGDPYYQTEASVKLNYYGINGIPALYIDGEEFSISGTYAGITEKLYDDLDNSLEKEAYFEFNLADADIDGNTVTIDLDITPYLTGEYKLYAAVIENETTGNVGSNGETEFPNVMMKMVPNAQGTLIDFTADEAYQTTLTASLQNTFIEDYGDLDVLIFIQDVASQQIMQAAKPVVTLSNDKFTSQNNLDIYPNPVTNGQLNINTQDEATMTIYDMTGRLVRNETALNVGKNTISVDGLSTGVYLVKTVSNNKSNTQKIIIQ